jgi:hypothetical protein
MWGTGQKSEQRKYAIATLAGEFCTRRRHKEGHSQDLGGLSQEECYRKCQRRGGPWDLITEPEGERDQARKKSRNLHKRFPN